MTPQLPESYDSAANPWAGNTSDKIHERMVQLFTNWCQYLPDINGAQDNGLDYIQDFNWLIYKNDFARNWVGGYETDITGISFLKAFNEDRADYMNSSSSLGKVENWINDDRIEIEDFINPNPDPEQPGKFIFNSWNQFFAREIITDGENIPSRPVSKPDEDYVVSSPTDCIMNPLIQVLAQEGGIATSEDFITNPLEANTVIDVKGIPISIDRLLGSASSELKNSFVGGSGVTCVLMPNTYHHYHAPVSGTIVHKEVVDINSDNIIDGNPASNNSFGNLDFPNFVPLSGVVGRPGTDIAQFERFQRGVIIIRVTYKDTDGSDITGYVASIPVGLETIGSVVLDDDYQAENTELGISGTTVTRSATRFGHFLYGGSLNIILFSKGIGSSAIQTRLGNQIAILSNGASPDVDPALPPAVTDF